MSFYIYRSSAGSGKTFTLAKTYLTLSLSGEQPDYYRHILAITFTNKATAEMRERILETLRVLSEGNNNPLTIEVQKELDIDEATLRQRANDMHENILAHHDYLAILTIDAFVHRLVRPFARELGIAQGFEIELEEKRVLQDAVDRVFDSAERDPLCGEFLFRYILDSLEDDKGWNVKKSVLDFAGHLLKEDAADAIKTLRNLSLPHYSEIINWLRKWKSEFETSMEERAKNLIQTCEENGIREDYLDGKSTVFKVIKKIGDVQIETLYGQASLRKYAEKPNWTKKSCPKDMVALVEDFTANARTLFLELLQQQNLYLLRIQLLKSIYAQGLLSEINRHVQRIREERNILLISDLHRRIGQLHQQSDANHIYEMTGLRFQHVLIDEFQDTSTLQWNNLKPLVINALSDGHDALVVGDAKQAIYRWRNGNARQFVHLHSDAGSRIIHESAKVVPLSTNYRSLPEIVGFNNELFALLTNDKSDTLTGNTYKDLQQTSHRNGTGFIEVFIPSVDNLQKEEKCNIHASYTVSTIQQLLLDGYLPGDIAVICRKSNQISWIAEALKKENIEINSDEALLLFNSHHVQTVYNLMMHLAYPGDAYFQKTLLVLCATALQKEDAVPELVMYKFDKQGKALRDALQKIGVTLPEFSPSNFNLHALYLQCVTALNLQKNYDNWLLEFENIVLDYQEKKGHVLKDFLTWFDSAKEKLAVPATGSKGVRLITIHKSKGLQFKIVLFPFADWRDNNTPEYMWYTPGEAAPALPVALLPLAKKMAETELGDKYAANAEDKEIDTLNLLYVALTRAEEQLYISAFEKSGAFKTASEILMQNAEFDAEKRMYRRGTKPLPSTVKIAKTASSPIDPSPMAFDYARLTTKGLTIEEADQPRLFGDRLHSLLARVRRSADFVRIAQLTDTLYHGEEELRKALLNTLTRMKENRHLCSLFDLEGELYCERPMSDGKGNILRPDRVVVGKEEVNIIDFKTGAAHESHKKQLNSYAAILQDMGHRNIIKHLLYTDTLDIETWSN